MALESTKRPKANIFRSDRWKQDHRAQPFLRSAAPAVCKMAHFCGACPTINSSYEQSLDDKYTTALARFREAGLLEGTTVAPAKAAPRVLGYRSHAKLAVRPAAEATVKPKLGERFAIGLFQPESHRLVHLDNCPLHRPSINRLLPDLKAELEASSIEPYSEAKMTGDLRYLAIRASHLTEELMLTFVCHDESTKVQLKAIVLRLRQKGHLLVSTHLNINSASTNAIFGPLTKKIAGADGLRESLCGLIFEIGPTSFFQVNPWQAETIYRRVEQIAGQAGPADVAWDLYCGTGQMTLLLAQQGYRTLGIEENPEAIRYAEANRERNRFKPEQGPSYVAGRVEDLLGHLPAWAERPSLMVVNPSRRGLAPMARQLLLDGLRQRSDSRLVYVSCEAETLIRDLKELLQDGRRLRQLECYDMFPFTEKLEWLAIIQ